MTLLRWGGRRPGSVGKPASTALLRSVEDELAEAKMLAAAGEYAAALAIWGPLAHRGVARAANNVGACFVDGLGVEREPEMAVRWLTIAAEGGDPAGQRNLATAYFRGLGVAEDQSAALGWYRKAAEAGDAEAQDMLSWMLVEGDLVEPDPVLARRWAEAAAGAGVAASMTRMGMFFHNALGVERDPEAAVSWWKRAVEAGDADAAAMLGAAHHLGQGVERDPLRAMVLLLMAKAGGSKLADPYFATIRAGVDDTGFARAERLAAAIMAETVERVP